MYNPRQREWQEKNLKAKLKKRISEVNDWFKDRINVKKWRAPEAVEKKIKSIIKSKKYINLIHYSVSGTFGDVKYSIDIDKKDLDAHLNTLGKSFLLSNHPDMAPLDIVWLFRQQFTVERAFKYLKTPTMISVRPMNCRKNPSVRRHLFTCVLGLLLLTFLTRKVQREHKKMNLPEIVKILSEIELVIIKYKGSKKIIKKIVDISKETEELSSFLELKAYI